MTIYGLDCSNHQGNMTGLAGFAASFFCHKLTEGTSYTDPYAAHNLAFARSQKVPVLGGYHYVRAGNGAGQADYFIDKAHALFGNDLRGKLWQLDCEDDASWADVKAFKQRWDARTGHTPIMFYTGDWWLQPRGWNVASLGFAGLWSAPNRGYVGKADNVRAGDWTANYGGFSKITIVQYDARSSIGDTNQFAGTLAQLKALCGAPAPTPPAPQRDEDDDVTTRTSLSITKDQTVAWGKFTTLDWPQENTDPDKAHRNGSYPGFVSPRSDYVDFDVLLTLQGVAAGDAYEIRVANHAWKAGAGSTGVAYEPLAKLPVVDPDQPIRAQGSLYLVDGHHLYVEVMPIRRASAAGAAAPRVTSGVWRIRQDGKS